MFVKCIYIKITFSWLITSFPLSSCNLNELAWKSSVWKELVSNSFQYLLVPFVRLINRKIRVYCSSIGEYYTNQIFCAFYAVTLVTEKRDIDKKLPTFWIYATWDKRHKADKLQKQFNKGAKTQLQLKVALSFARQFPF